MVTAHPNLRRPGPGVFAACPTVRVPLSIEEGIDIYLSAIFRSGLGLSGLFRSACLADPGPWSIRSRSMGVSSQAPPDDRLPF